MLPVISKSSRDLTLTFLRRDSKSYLGGTHLNLTYVASTDALFSDNPRTEQFSHGSIARAATLVSLQPISCCTSQGAKRSVGQKHYVLRAVRQ